MAPPPPLTANSSPFWLPRGSSLVGVKTLALFGTLRPPIKIQRYGPKYSEWSTSVLMIRQTKPDSRLVFEYGDIRLHYENWLQSVREAGIFHVHGAISSQLTACFTYHVHPARSFYIGVGKFFVLF
jgi:hypothetical protein